MVQSLSGISLPPEYGSSPYGRSTRQAEQIGTLVSGRDGGVSAARQSEALSPEDQRKVEALQKIDRTVREHEQAHLRVGRDLVLGGPSYTYTIGPDQKRYAVAGEVSIDTSPASTPEKTIPKAQRIRATALAPAEPSAQDRRVAAKAGTMESEARIELELQRRDEAAARAEENSGFQEASASIRVAAGYASYGAATEAGPAAVGALLDLFA